MPVLRLRDFTLFLGLLGGCAGDDHDPLASAGPSTGAVTSTTASHEASTSPTTTDAATTDAATTDAATTGAATTGEPEGTTGGPADDLSPKVYPADDPRIQYTGRVEFGDPASPTFSAPGVYVTARFRGVSAAVHLEDQFVWDIGRNFYEVVVDGAAVMKLAPEKGVTRYVVATGLANTTHTITLVKRTESALGWCKFKGFEFEGELDEPRPRPTRRMAFIGDSITVGSGNEAANGSAECSADAYGNAGGWGQPYHNNWRSYGAVAARSLDAEYHVTAVSGIGLVRNYSFLYDARPMPAVHDLVFLELQQGSPTWAPQQFVPDVVVVALGTNDFSLGDSDRPRMTVAEFGAAYVEFVAELRDDYPDSHIILASSPMLGDGWPTPADQFLTDQKTALAAVEAEFAAGGDPRVHAFTTTKLVGEGCGTHPSAAQHEAMAAELAEFVRAKVGW